MKEIISRIYELTNAAILTPYNLLENITLDNYYEIKYSKKAKHIICEMLCIEEKDSIIYHYEFDFDNKLQLAYALLDKEKLSLFDREKELQELLWKYDCYNEMKREAC